MTKFSVATMESHNSSSVFRLKHLARCVLVFLSICTTITASAQNVAAADAKGLKPILDYISTAWDTLTRSMTY